MTIFINAVEAADQFGKLTEGEGYMIVAKDLLQGVEALSILPPTVHPRSCSLLAAHALECALKAFLWCRGKEKELVKVNVRHNLAALWSMAYGEGLSIPQAQPDWCMILSEGHAQNYYYRYQKGVKVNKKCVIPHGGQYPALGPMMIGLKDLIRKVELTIKKT